MCVCEEGVTLSVKERTDQSRAGGETACVAYCVSSRVVLRRSVSQAAEEKRGGERGERRERGP